MTVTCQTVLTSQGVQLFLDDVHPQRAYALPTGLEVARDDSNGYRFSLLFYQEDYPQRGARLVMSLRPTYPAVTREELQTTLGDGAELLSLPFDEGQIQFLWPTFLGAAEPVRSIVGGVIQIEISLTQPQAAALRQLLNAGIETARIMVRLAYSHNTLSLPVKAHILFRDTAALIYDQIHDDLITGLLFRDLISRLTPPAAALQAEGELATLPPEELWKICSPCLAPLMAANLAEMVQNELTFDERIFRLRPPDQVQEAKIWVDLSQPRPWRAVWQGEWSLTAFHQHVVEAGETEHYFPEVLYVPAVGQVPVLVENLLTISPDTVQEVQVSLKHKRLGGLEEEVFEARFDLDSGPVARHRIPLIAFTPLRYQSMVRLLLAPDSPGQPPKVVPSEPVWQEHHQPLVQVGREYLPAALIHATVGEGVFQYVGRVELEFAPPGDEPPEALASAVLTAEQPYCWLFIWTLPATTTTIRWRPSFYQDSAGATPPVRRDWRTADSLWVLLDPWEVYPQEPRRVTVEVRKGDTPEINLVSVQLRSGALLTGEIKPEVEWSFIADETRTMVLWPTSIFERSFVYRYGLSLSGGETYWSPWKLEDGNQVEVNVEDEFYFKRTLEVTLKAPWSERRSPDSTSRTGEIIFAEVHLSVPSSLETQSRSFTFDIDNKGVTFRWEVRFKKGVEQYQYEVEVLSLDGRLLKFGPFMRTTGKLALEIIRKSVGNTALPEFDLREQES